MWAVRTQQAKWESLALPLPLTAHSLTSLVLDMKETKTMCGVQTFPTHTCTHAHTHTNAHTQAHTRMPFLSALASQPLLSQQQSPPTQTHITGSPVPIFEPGSATSKVLFSPTPSRNRAFPLGDTLTAPQAGNIASTLVGEREKGQQTLPCFQSPTMMGLPRQTGKARPCHVSLDSTLAKSI